MKNLLVKGSSWRGIVFWPPYNDARSRNTQFSTISAFPSILKENAHTADTQDEGKGIS